MNSADNRSRRASRVPTEPGTWSGGAPMNTAAVTQLARTLLYEGYILYPYRRSALKNQKRWAIGTLYPPGFAMAETDRSTARVECLLEGTEPHVTALAGFLHGIERHDADGLWYEASERHIEAGPYPAEQLLDKTKVHPFDLQDARWQNEGARYEQHALFGRIASSATRVGEDVFRLRVELVNETPFQGSDRDAAHVRGLIAAHLLLFAHEGRFISATDPPRHLEESSAGCHSEGLYAAIVGSEASVLLAAPIIVPDGAQVADESPFDLFDATEIDEILSLRILTMTDAEKTEAQRSDPRARALITRTNALTTSERAALHGALRSRSACHFRPGDPVRIRPKPGGDALDIVLAGQLATVQAVETDFEARVHVAVVLDVDPGQDLGLAGKPGHRFFFAPDELEPVS